MGCAVLGWTEGPSVRVPPGAESVVGRHALSTVGCRGAAGFFKCEVTYSADKAVEATESAVAPALRMAVRISERDGKRRFQNWVAVERSAEDLVRVVAHVTAVDLPVDGAESDRAFVVDDGVQVYA